MHRVSLSVLAATVPLALSVQAAQAQTAGTSSEGTGAAPRAISTATLPASTRPMATPVIDDVAVLEEVGRAMLDEEALRARFGVTTLSADGTVAEAPAGEAVMRAIMGEGDHTPGTESTPDPAFEDPEAERERFIGPQDTRKQISDPSDYPITAVGLLFAVYGEDGMSCSATLIGPATLVSAAHCVYDHENGWPDNILYVPAMMDEDTTPYGVWEYDRASILTSYIEEYEGVYGEVIPFDLAVITLAEPIGNELGWLGFAPTADIPGFDATILSYPADKPFGTLWQSTCEVSFSNDTATDLAFVHLCQTYQGSSGGSMYAYYPENDERTVHGINVAEVQGEDGFNISVRMNETYFQWIAERWQ